MDDESGYGPADAARRAEVMALPVVRVRHHAHLVAPRPGDVRLCASVGPSGEVVALWSKAEDLSALRSVTVGSGGAAFPDSRALRPVGAQVTVHVPDTAVVAEIAGLTVAFPTVQPLPGDRVLVVGARCRWLPGGPERNAVVYGPDGAVLGERTLGDGIEHVLTSRRGDVWVGYFDEGVYGNRGWGFGGGGPLGEWGLNRFSPDLDRTWHYPQHAVAAWGTIDDCYALNVHGDTAWVCYYYDFPIVRIHDGTVTGWHNDVRGARALVVGNARVALYGGYGPDHDRLVTGVLDGDRFHVTGEHRLVQPDGQPLPAATQVFGRGPDLHLLTEDTWWRLALEDVPTGSAR